jgi:serine acetyltransferase
LALHISLIIAPILHLFSYVILKYLFKLSTTEESYPLYSSVYYQWWFLHRLWKLNHPWHQILYGTSLYNTYLRLCGARIGSGTHLETSSIDVPHLIDIGENTFVGEDVILSSMTYDNTYTFKLTSVHIGNNCSIGARSVLHSKVFIENDVTVKSLSSVCEYLYVNRVVF